MLNTFKNKNIDFSCWHEGFEMTAGSQHLNTSYSSIPIHFRKDLNPEIKFGHYHPGINEMLSNL